MRETSIETDLRKGVIDRGGECLKFVSPGRIGVPDRIVLMPLSTIIFVETKAPGKRANIVQERFHAMLRELGFRVEVICTPQQVNEFLESL